MRLPFEHGTVLPVLHHSHLNREDELTVKQIAPFLGYSSFVSKKRICNWMYGNKYDTDVTVWSPEGKLHQVCLHVES